MARLTIISFHFFALGSKSLLIPGIRRRTFALRPLWFPSILLGGTTPTATSCNTINKYAACFRCWGCAGFFLFADLAPIITVERPQSMLSMCPGQRRTRLMRLASKHGCYRAVPLSNTTITRADTQTYSGDSTCGNVN